jgi:hypothetical protein
MSKKNVNQGAFKTLKVVVDVLVSTNPINTCTFCYEFLVLNYLEALPSP